MVEVGDVKWPGLRQWCRVNRVRIHPKTGTLERKTNHFMTSLPASQSTPEQVLHLIRNHWGIENTLHRTRDTLMREDASTIRTQNAPQTLAACRNTAINRLKHIHKSPTRAVEITAMNTAVAINQLLI